MRCQADQEEPFGDGWQRMDSAPKGGQVVEIEMRGGVKPHRGIYRWVEGSGWRSATDPRIGIYYGAYRWRSHAGDILTYRDPFNGFDAYDYAILGKRPTNALLAAEERRCNVGDA